jgi:hypothetical protein
VFQRTVNSQFRSGDKSNHIPALHVPQLYYFVAFSTAFGWPVLISGNGGVSALASDVGIRMFGSKLCVPLRSLCDQLLILLHSRTLTTVLVSSGMAVMVKLFTFVSLLQLR